MQDYCKPHQGTESSRALKEDVKEVSDKIRLELGSVLPKLSLKRQWPPLKK